MWLHRSRGPRNLLIPLPSYGANLRIHIIIMFTHLGGFSLWRCDLCQQVVVPFAALGQCAISRVLLHGSCGPRELLMPLHKQCPPLCVEGYASCTMATQSFPLWLVVRWLASRRCKIDSRECQKHFRPLFSHGTVCSWRSFFQLPNCDVDMASVWFLEGAMLHQLP